MSQIDLQRVHLPGFDSYRTYVGQFEGAASECSLKGHHFLKTLNLSPLVFPNMRTDIRVIMSCDGIKRSTTIMWDLSC